MPRGACDIATEILGCIVKGNVLGTLSRSSTLLHKLCGPVQKAKNIVESPLQNTTTQVVYFGQQENISR